MAIRLLDENTINKIAAGEVIERPASVLKELLENAADSGATRIEVDFARGGKSLIMVSDNGSGISEEDLKLAILRHATSKIQSFEDLVGLQTAGFRGEALASIAAVSELQITSATEGEQTGHTLIAKGGVWSSEAPLPAAPLKGTTVEVRDLFFNVPARQKFLKSESGETSAFKRVFKAFALGHPSTELLLRQDGKLLLHYGRQTFLQRSVQVLGLKEADTIATSHEELGIQGFFTLALPKLNAATAQNIWILVDGRPITDKTIQAALIEGYRGVLMHQQFPQAVIDLRLEPGMMDFNVHPAKTQVRFQNPSDVFRFVSRAIHRAFERDLAPKSHQQMEDATAATQSLLLADASTQYRVKPSFSELQIPVVEEALTKKANWTYQVIGQFANTYLVCQNQRGLILIDQHAAHERILFERLKRQFASQTIPVQPSLMTEIIELEKEAVETLTVPKNAAELQKLGFDLEPMSQDSVALRSRPLFLVDQPIKPLLEKLAEEFFERGSMGVLQDKLDHVFATMACHGAIRAGRTLNQEEMENLLEQMDEFAFSSFCPHGRPVHFQMTLTEIEKEFKRIL